MLRKKIYSVAEGANSVSAYDALEQFLKKLNQYTFLLDLFVNLDSKRYVFQIVRLRYKHYTVSCKSMKKM